MQTSIKELKRFRNGELLQYRILQTVDGERWQVYSDGLEHWAECLSEERAKIICEALEKLYVERVS